MDAATRMTQGRDHADDAAGRTDEWSGSEPLGRTSHPLFDPWLTCDHPDVDALCNSFAVQLERLEPHRQRRRKVRDSVNRAAVIRAIVSNLAHAVTIGADPPTVAVSLRSARKAQTRYDRRGFTTLPNVLAALDGGPLTLRRSATKGSASTITAESGFIAHLRESRGLAERFREAPGRECIWLSRTERDYVAGTATQTLVDYRETEETGRLRGEMELINNALAGADIAMETGGGPIVVTTAGRCLRRQFKLLSGDRRQRFDQGGRLFGGWWQNLPKTSRSSIRIDGEPIADLDYTNMFLRLAYLHAGTPPPEGDLYATTAGLSEACWRPGVKLMAAAMFFRSTPLTKLPKGSSGLLPPQASGRQVRDAILAAHPKLKTTFETGVGWRLMHTESRILMDAMLRLTEAGITALPMHDGLMVARSKASAATRAMLGAAANITGYQMPIVLK